MGIETMIDDKSRTELSFFTHLNLRQSETVRKLLWLIYDQGRDFAPEVFDDGKQLVPISSTNFEELVQRWGHLDSVLMRRDKQFLCEIAISTQWVASGFNTLSLWVEENYFELQEHTEAFLRLSIAIYDLLRPVYGAIHQARDAIEMATVQHPKYGRTVVPVDLRKGLPGIYWANFFNPEYVAAIGKSKLLLAPCDRIVELADGGLLILTATSPLAPSLEIKHSKRNVLREYLGEDLFYRWG